MSGRQMARPGQRVRGARPVSVLLVFVATLFHVESASAQLFQWTPEQLIRYTNKNPYDRSPMADRRCMQAYYKKSLPTQGIRVSRRDRTRAPSAARSTAWAGRRWQFSQRLTTASSLIGSPFAESSDS